MPIHRHAALAPLSRDHHLALQLARAVQTGASPHLRAELPSGPRALAAHVREVFAQEIEKHFFAEDQVILAGLDAHDAELDAPALARLGAKLQRHLEVHQVGE